MHKAMKRFATALFGAIVASPLCAADIDRSAVDFTPAAEIKWMRNASGNWWMGTGEKFDPDSTVGAPAGSYVIHRAGRVHYDGAKGEEVIIQLWGMGPATATPAEKR